MASKREKSGKIILIGLNWRTDELVWHQINRSQPLFFCVSVSLEQTIDWSYAKSTGRRSFSEFSDLCWRTAEFGPRELCGQSSLLSLKFQLQVLYFLYLISFKLFYHQNSTKRSNNQFVCIYTKTYYIIQNKSYSSH